ncbi:GerAB/ArcD/ProY family transporter [Oceanobacillus halophilus]|uniref:Uncharacterized protein n=1 Tax=Oceanobacillus halophilus TaxID=930130 RepID=A0A495A4R5_9BACI|nr:endospore germination permease [Oceanobacillus halophilus]RKQ34259.1 hypothetical protein D8M06_07710 [Oceanobacillus halophilus]
MLTKWETLFLIIMAIAVMGHVVVTPLLMDVAGRDGWISIFLSLPFALLFAFAIYRLRLKYPESDMVAISRFLLGKLGGRVLIFLFLSYFLFLTIYSFALLIDFVHIGFLPETPRLPILIWFLIFFVYAVIKGIKRIALTASILTAIAMFTGHSITLLDTRLKDWGELRPFLEFGINPVLWGTLLLISIWMELLFLLFLPIQNTNEKRMFLLWSIGIFLNALFMLSTYTGSIAIFGLGQSDNFVYPALESVRIISLGFIDRFDIYGLLLMSVGIYIRCSLFFRIAYNMTVDRISSSWIKYGLFVFLILFVSICAYFLSADHMRLDHVLNIYAYLVILFPVPFLLLSVSHWKERRYLGKWRTTKRI